MWELEAPATVVWLAKYRGVTLCATRLHEGIMARSPQLVEANSQPQE
jgi:hypothetical protein